MSATRKTKPDADGPREADLYPTPAWAVEAVAELVLDSRPKDKPVVYDAGAGEGAILRVLKASVLNPRDNFRGCELRDSATAACWSQGLDVQTMDFLNRTPTYTWDIGAWVMNPPYGGRLVPLGSP